MSTASRKVASGEIRTTWTFINSRTFTKPDSLQSVQILLCGGSRTAPRRSIPTQRHSNTNPAGMLPAQIEAAQHDRPPARGLTEMPSPESQPARHGHRLSPPNRDSSPDSRRQDRIQHRNALEYQR